MTIEFMLTFYLFKYEHINKCLYVYIYINDKKKFHHCNKMVNINTL